MNIDERLDRVTERHEALTQSVELISHQTAASAFANAANAVAIGALTKDMAGLKDAVNILVQMAASHENRTDRLEQK